jgi:aspartate aminotransferase-like enzyme/GNAT superfamily N-acetyltransferase
MAELQYKIADRQEEFDAIHRLNYQTFVEEIPQHAPNAVRLLVDRFHEENTYAVCLDGSELIGMVAGRCQRPFSLDTKVADLDRHLPRHDRAVEIRLLAVKPEFRYRPVFARLIVQLARHFRALGCDLALISGTVRQLALYEHLGFQAFGPLVGTADALYQPMYLTLESWRGNRALFAPSEPPRGVAEFLPGPVAVLPAVRSAFQSQPVSHRSAEFAQRMQCVRMGLRRLTGAGHVAVLAGTGTLANDAIAAQLRHDGRPGLVLANGEFGERLAAHARAWQLRHDLVKVPWGEAFDWSALHSLTRRVRPAWIWAVLSETSTGMTNAVSNLRSLSEGVGAALCLDAVSAVGLMPVDLRGVWLASAVSGKGLAAYAGLAIVFHDGRVAPAGAVPKYLDLAAYEAARGVPYTQPSNLVAALDCVLSTTLWEDRFRRIAAVDRQLRSQLNAHGLPPLVTGESATPGIITLGLPETVDSSELALALRGDGIGLAYESQYLRCRNWLQICLMGEFDTATVERTPGLLAAHLRRGVGSAASRPERRRSLMRVV